jgi:type I restriction enzyme S subunit
MNKSVDFFESKKIPAQKTGTNKKVQFGDVAKKISNIVDPLTSGLSYYIEGGDIRTNDLQIKTWSKIGSSYLGPAFNHKFLKGQILYISRNPHLRKVGIPHFDGICANTTFVLEPQGNDIIPELIPFIMQSEAFVQHTMRKAKGSTNPYINWKDMACYEFVVPRKEEQRHILTLLLAGESSLVNAEVFLTMAERAKQVFMNVLFREGIGHSDFKFIQSIGRIPKKWNVTTLGDITDIVSGATLGRKLEGKTILLPYLRVANVQDGFIDLTEIKEIKILESEKNKWLLKDGDILLTEGGDWDQLGRGGIWRGEIPNCIHQNHIFRVRIIDPNVDVDYLHFLINSPFGKSFFLRCSKQTTNLASINQSQLKKFIVLQPPLPEQRQIAAILTRCDEMIAAARANVVAAKALKMKMINEMLSPGM